MLRWKCVTTPLTIQEMRQFSLTASPRGSGREEWLVSRYILQLSSKINRLGGGLGENMMDMIAWYSIPKESQQEAAWEQGRRITAEQKRQQETQPEQEPSMDSGNAGDTE
jgi:hypothetical protein